MPERRSFWKITFTIQIFNFALIVVTALFITIFFALWKIVVELQYSSVWQVYLVILQVSLTGFFLVLLIFMFVILNRILGPIPRMEKVLEKVINGDYSLRITVRKKDIIHSFVDKLNKVIDLLESKSKR